MIVSAAVCPQAPGLVPELGVGLAQELAAVRVASGAAVTAMLAAMPERVIVVGDLTRGGSDASWDETAGGTLAGFGRDVRAGGPDIVLPPGLTMGAWFLDEAAWRGPRIYTSELGDAEGRVGVLVMADGSSRHRRLAPEWSDPKGRAFDAAVASDLAAGDADALASLDLELAEEIGASGLDGLVALGHRAKGARIAARLHFDGAPFDVGYWVADWVIE